MGSNQAKLDIRIKQVNVQLKSHGFTKSPKASIKNLVIQRRKQGFKCTVNSIKKLHKQRIKNGWKLAGNAEEWIESYINRYCLIKVPELEFKKPAPLHTTSIRRDFKRKRINKNNSICDSSSSTSSNPCFKLNFNKKHHESSDKNVQNVDNSTTDDPAAKVLNEDQISCKAESNRNQTSFEQIGKIISKRSKEKTRNHKKAENSSPSSVFSQPSIDPNLKISESKPKGNLLQTGFDINKEYKIDYENESELIKKLKPGELFIDKSIELFEANPNPNLIENENEKSIPIEWLEPEKIASNPMLIQSDLSREEIIEGELGDGQFCVALNVIMRYQNLIYKLLPEENENCLSSKESYKGYLKFRFWSFGEWVDIYIDDKLPTKKGWLLSCRAASSLNIFWPALMEKAFAKFVGSYKNLFNLTSGEILTALTGGLFLTFKTSQLSTIPRQYDFEDANKYLIGFTSKKPSEETFMKENYCSVLALNKIFVNNRKLRIYTLKNACEKTKYNKYPYYNADLKLADDDTKRKIMYPNRDDSISWFAGFEMRKMFDFICWLYVLPEKRNHTESYQFDFIGKWNGTNLAPKEIDSYVNNPHYLLSVSNKDAKRKTEVIINLNLNVSDLTYKSESNRSRKIDLWMFNVENLEKLEDELMNRIGYVYYSFNDCDIQPLDLSNTQGSVTLHLFNGNYLLMPIIHEIELKSNKPSCHYMFRLGSTEANAIDVKELVYKQNEYGLSKFYTNANDDESSYINVIIKKCMICDELILPRDKTMSADRTVYHSECYESLNQCDNCGKQTNKPIKTDHNLIKCESCYKQLNELIESLNSF